MGCHSRTTDRHFRHSSWRNYRELIPFHQSSRKARQWLSRACPKTACMVWLNTAGALVRAKGITRHWFSPMKVVNTVLCRSSSLIPICQYPLCGSTFWAVTLFGAHRLQQNLNVLSRFGTSTTGELQGSHWALLLLCVVSPQFAFACGDQDVWSARFLVVAQLSVSIVSSTRWVSPNSRSEL